MKKLLSGKHRAHPEISAPVPYPQSSIPQEPRIPPVLYRPTDQPHLQHPQQHQPDLQNPPHRAPSERRTSQQQQQQQQPQQLEPPLGYVQGGIPQQQIISPHDERTQDFRNSYIAQQQQRLQPGPPQPQEKKEKSRFRDILGLGSGHKQSSDQLGGKTQGIHRSTSIRGKGSPNPADKYSEEAQRAHWTKHNNSSQLLSPTEEDEDAQHNQFQQRGYIQGRPPVPIKDGEQLYQPQQEYYPPPGTLQGISANPNFPPGQDVYVSPEQHQLQLQQQQGQFAGYSELQLQQIQAQQFQHYPPPQGLQGHAHPQAPPPGYGHPPVEQVVPPGQEPPEESQTPTQESAEQNEIHAPLPSRNPTKKGQQDKLYLQAPGGSTAGQSPPSPFPGQNQSTESQLPPQPPSPSSTQQSAPSPMPPPSRSGGGQAGPGASQQTFRGPPEADRGRTTPSSGNLEMTEDDVAHYHQLMKDHKELKEKYQKVKKYYFEKESQVHQLQNAIANQRLSQSRTSLDDSEYIARFERLGGLMAQLSFSIRKSWKDIPQWMHRAVNKDAIVTGKQEMTAVGRAYLSWWLYTNVFERIFHPDLDINLSMALKSIAIGIRDSQAAVHSNEEAESLTAELASWRMATIKGVDLQLRSHLAQQNRAQLVKMINERLVADISAFLTDPAPPDLAGGIAMIVDLSVMIAQHLPVESREVCITYCWPMDIINPEVMKVETGIPALTNPIVSAVDNSPSDSTGSDKDTLDDKDDDTPLPPAKDEPSRRSRGGLLGNIMGTNNPAPKGAPGSQQPPPGAQGGPKGPQPGAGKTAPNGPGRETEAPQKQEVVRLSIGLGVAIRNRSVLVKVPVYTTPI